MDRLPIDVIKRSTQGLTLGGKVVGAGITFPMLLEVGALCVIGPTTSAAQCVTLKAGIARIEATNINSADAHVLELMFPVTHLLMLDVSITVVFTACTHLQVDGAEAMPSQAHVQRAVQSAPSPSLGLAAYTKSM